MTSHPVSLETLPVGTIEKEVLSKIASEVTSEGVSAAPWQGVPEPTLKESPVIVDTQVMTPTEQINELVPVASVNPKVRILRGRRGPDILPKQPAQESLAVSPVTVATEQVAVSSGVPVSLKEEEIKEVAQESFSLENMRASVTRVNDELNEFAHGKAFQWLSDPKSGYREYMTELVALRGILSGTVAEADFSAIEMRILNLEEMARIVQNAVKVGMVGVPASKEQQMRVSGSPAPASVLSPAEDPKTAPQIQKLSVMTDIPMVPAVVEDPVILESVVPPVSESESPAQTVFVDAEPLIPPIAPTQPEVSVDAGEETEQDSVVPVEAHVSQQPPSEQVSNEPADPTALDNPMITTGLNNLLTQWLGTTGFLGFGDSGVKHPDWLLIKDLYVDDIHTKDGIIPKGLRPETFENLAENLHAWSVKYGLYVEGPTETIEHFMRRVVYASISRVT